MKMQPGDLVKPRIDPRREQSWWLYKSIPEGVAVAWRVVRKPGPRWAGNMVGIVLEVNVRRGYVKILTPTGPGWAYRRWVERA